MMADPPSSTSEQAAPESASTTIASTGGFKDPSPKSPISSSSPTPQSSTSSTTVPEQDAAKRTAEAKTAFLASLHSVGSTVDSGLQTRAADISSNSAAIAKQEEQLDKSTTALSKETAKYQKLADETRTKLKDIGDVQNFAEVIERELLVLEETLRIVENGEELGEEDAPEGSSAQDPKPGEKKKKRWFT